MYLLDYGPPGIAMLEELGRPYSFMRSTKPCGMSLDPFLTSIAYCTPCEF
jgi:hypothetical protein